MRRIILLVPLAAALLASGVVLAQTGGGFDLSWSSVGGGVSSITGGGYTLSGAIGQADASSGLTGGVYTLVGGFWGIAAISAEPALTPTPTPTLVPGVTTWGLLTMTGLLLVVVLGRLSYIRIRQRG